MVFILGKIFNRNPDLFPTLDGVDDLLVQPVIGSHRRRHHAAFSDVRYLSITNEDAAIGIVVLIADVDVDEREIRHVLQPQHALVPAEPIAIATMHAALSTEFNLVPARIVEQYQADAALEDALKQIQNHLKTLNAQRKAVNNSKRDDEWKEEKVEKIELKKTQLMNKFNKKYNEIRDKRRNQQEQARIDPQLSGSDRLAAVKDFNQAGYPAMASLIKSLPTNPSSDFVEKLNA